MEAHRAFESALAYQEDQPTVRAETLSAMATADQAWDGSTRRFAHGSEAIEIYVDRRSRADRPELHGRDGRPHVARRYGR